MISLLGLLYPALLFANIFFLVVWLFLDLKYVLLSLIAILIGYQHLDSIFTINTYDKISDSDLVVMSYNIGNAAHYNKDNKIVVSDITGLVNIIQDHKEVDVICLQECNGKIVQKLDVLLPEYRLITDGHQKQKIYSRLPSTASGKLPTKKYTNGIVWADIIYDDHSVRIYSAHLQTNSVTKYANKVINEAELGNKETVDGFKEIFRRYKNAAIIRERQVNDLITMINNTDRYHIVGGDFNDTPLSYTFSRVNEILEDSYTTSGSGIGTTFRGRIPFLRIDYLLYSDGLINKRFSIGNEKFSDHYPIFASYKLK